MRDLSQVEYSARDLVQLLNREEMIQGFCRERGALLEQFLSQWSGAFCDFADNLLYITSQMYDAEMKVTLV